MFTLIHLVFHIATNELCIIFDNIFLFTIEGQNTLHKKIDIKSSENDFNISRKFFHMKYLVFINI